MAHTLFDKQGHNIPSAILSDKEIIDFVNDGSLINKETYSSACVEASSYDIRAGKKGIIGGGGQEVDLTKSHLEIPPGSYAGIISFEKIRLPKIIAARLGAKRALSYDGIILLTGSIVDPSYEGHLLFGLYNASQKKVLIRLGKKICNIVFEKLSIEPEKAVNPDANLLNGDFPDKFIEAMYNMEVLPWMQISERVKQIETITAEIIDLKKRYNDVMKPISELTENVKDLTKNVNVINKRTEQLTEDLDKSSGLITENGRQIQHLMGMVGTLTTEVKEQERDVQKLNTSVRNQSILYNILWAIALVILSVLITWKIVKGN